ncbi:MAG: polyprenyl synthetase family protein [Prevotellaceae bacterium]|nr:polyprenyl synthetase family protein [Prevotellaceae bacterium]
MYTSDKLLSLVDDYIARLCFDRQPAGLYNPVVYVLSMGGKRLRPLLMLLAYNLYREDVERVLPSAAGIEIYHNYTLLHDDLMDRADLRRGKTTVHKLWNDNVAILSGDAMLVLAYQYMARCADARLKEVMDLFSHTALEICEGQQWDMEFESRLDVSEAEYIEMIRLKTSVLLAASLKTGALLAGAPQADADALYQTGVSMGLAFQLRDDWLDVYGDTARFGKNIGGDILCNKKTFLLVKALECASGETACQLKRWLEADCPDAAEKVAAVTALYDRLGVGPMCEARVEAYSTRALACLDSVALPAARKHELEGLVRKLVHREV